MHSPVRATETSQQQEGLQDAPGPGVEVDLLDRAVVDALLPEADVLPPVLLVADPEEELASHSVFPP